MYEKGWALTEFRTYATATEMPPGRPKQWNVRITLPLTKELVQRLDSARVEGEDRLNLIRKGIERELSAREKAKPKS